MSWNREEDDQLMQLAQDCTIQGIIFWNMVAASMPNRSELQLFERYHKLLLRPPKKGRFTAEEDRIIMKWTHNQGESFLHFNPNRLPGRTKNAIRARYMNTLRFANCYTSWTLADDKKLLEFVLESLAKNDAIHWGKCAKLLGNRSRHSCRSRYYTIYKHIDSGSGTTLAKLPRRKNRLQVAAVNVTPTPSTTSGMWAGGSDQATNGDAFSSYVPSNADDAVGEGDNLGEEEEEEGDNLNAAENRF
ncbi:myb-related protein A-like [Anopheles marshallii]|uniref:myb-related protein A-like n=1 Tax=Anopheles marshallii TaxID=1521116 RepID=UPI00237C3C37|nr:myb-related protein A-like [Anopheles marshallii]